MSSFNDLIQVKFTDGATTQATETADSLGIVLNHFWGPSNEIVKCDEAKFYSTFPEAVCSRVANTTNLWEPYAKVKQYFANGGSTVYVYNAAKDTAGNSNYYGLTTAVATNYYATFKYKGYPSQLGKTVMTFALDGSVATAALYNYDEASVSHIGSLIESFSGQLTDPTATIDGESTFLPTIVEKYAQYLRIATVAPSDVTTLDTTPWSAGDTTSTTLLSVFGTSSSLLPTQFLTYDAGIDAFETSNTFVSYSASESVKSKFKVNVRGTESVKVAGGLYTIPCNASVAGAYARVGQEVNLNQIASAQSYGVLSSCVLTSSWTFSDASDGMASGIVTVFNSEWGPMIFGTRNSMNSTRPNSYFSRINVSRVIASILKNVKPRCFQAIHTATASDDILRAQFQVDIQSILNNFIASGCIQADSTCQCDANNNSDAQTVGGTILNVLLILHVKGLVEKIKINVVATDSSVTTQIQ